MLTKDLLKFSKRDSRIHPKYLKPQDVALINQASHLIAIFKAFVGQNWRDLQEELKSHFNLKDVIIQGFCKLLEDRCDFADASESIESKRWEWFALSHKLRSDRAQSRAEFQRYFHKATLLEFGVIQQQIYSDLPDFKTILKFNEITPDLLVDRYNAAQIQGLLLRAVKVKFIIHEKNLVSRRRLLQRLRFCRLLAELKEQTDDTLTFEISGPLAIFDQVQSYGLRLCQFFPYVLLMSSWELIASIKILEDFYELKVNSSKPIRSHYKGFNGYIPEEFSNLTKNFNALEEKERKFWLAEEGSELLNLGGQSYCFPDFTFRNKNGKLCHLELFHRWHGAELKKRLGFMASRLDSDLLVGVSQDLCKEAPTESLVQLAESNCLGVFRFRNFPTLKAILTHLPEI
jgi:predicted nuclease of restriction endonuclease-like RecB superfamily